MTKPTPRYSADVRDAVRKAFAAGQRPKAIAAHIPNPDGRGNPSIGTIKRWAKQHGWSVRTTSASTEGPYERGSLADQLLQTVLADDYGLYPYQREFLLNPARFRIVTKARQIGFSWVVGLSVLLGALAGRNQIIVSASALQAQVLLNYVRDHAQRLGITPDQDKAQMMMFGSARIDALATNPRTVQSRAGDVWLDEFAWVHQQRALWGAVVPSITAVGGRLTVFSTPFLPGSLFWELSTNHKAQFDRFERWTITLDDALGQGMSLPGGVDELRSLFDAETWSMFYDCQWAEDGTALLPWSMLHDLTDPGLDPSGYHHLQAGVDVGRINDATAIALIGEAIDHKASDAAYALVHHELHKGLPFKEQKGIILGLDRRRDIASWKVDQTGLGMQLAEELTNHAPARFQGVWFSARRKARLALNLLRLCETGSLKLPNDPTVLAQLHAVKKQRSANGIRYDADRNKDGHGDLFWAIALAAEDCISQPMADQAAASPYPPVSGSSRMSLEILD